MGKRCSKLEQNWQNIASLHHTALGDSARLHIYLQVPEGCQSEPMSQMVLSLKADICMSLLLYHMGLVMIVEVAINLSGHLEKNLFQEENQ